MGVTEEYGDDTVPQNQLRRAPLVGSDTASEAVTEYESEYSVAEGAPSEVASTVASEVASATSAVAVSEVASASGQDARTYAVGDTVQIFRCLHALLFASRLPSVSRFSSALASLCASRVR